MNVALVEQAFQTGRLLHPICDRPSFLDLTVAVAKGAGVTLPGASVKSAVVSDFIGEAEHLVFVLVDGMGWTLLDGLPPDAFLRSQRMMELRAVFPSTTACALTTVTTGLWPGQHGVPGWWVYLEERNLSVITLPFQERFAETPLEKTDVLPAEIWPFNPWMKNSVRDSLSIMSHWFSESTFSRYSRGNTPGLGYKMIAGAVDMILDRVGRVTERSYTHLYLPEFDSDCHR